MKITKNCSSAKCFCLIKKYECAKKYERKKSQVTLLISETKIKLS